VPDLRLSTAADEHKRLLLVGMGMPGGELPIRAKTEVAD
jgi:UDP-N-acetyl-D-mannosaminuronic acid transferase (WecB/TagA/CpsF family)